MSTLLSPKTNNTKLNNNTIKETINNTNLYIYRYMYLKILLMHLPHKAHLRNVFSTESTWTVFKLSLLYLIFSVINSYILGAKYDNDLILLCTDFTGLV